MTNYVDSDPRIVAAIESMSGTEATSVTAFHDQFFSLDPTNAYLVSRDQLRASLPLRKQMFASIGATGTTLRDVTVTHLDDRHALAATSWDVVFQSDDDEPLVLESSYLLRLIGDEWKVLAYINHHDIVASLAARHHPSDSSDDGAES